MTILDWKGEPVDVEPIRAQEQDAYEARLGALLLLPPAPPIKCGEITIPPPLPRWVRFRIWLACLLVRLLRVDIEELQ